MRKGGKPPTYKIYKGFNAMKKNLFIFAGFALFTFLFLYWGKIWALLSPIIGAFALTYLAFPFVRAFSKKMPMALAALLFYIVIFGTIILLIIFIFPATLKGIESLISALPSFEEKISAFFPTFSIEDFTGYLKGKAGNIVKLLSDTFSILISWGIAVVLSFFLLMDTNKLKESFLSLVPSPWIKALTPTFREIDSVFKGFLRGQLLVSVIISAATFIVLLILKVEYALILSIFYGIFCIIPTVGPILGAIPVVALSFLNSPMTALWTTLAIVITQVLDNIFLSPKIKADSVDISPASAIIAIYLGSALFGFSGIILGVPIFASLKIIFRRILSAISLS